MMITAMLTMLLIAGGAEPTGGGPPAGLQGDLVAIVRELYDAMGPGDRAAWDRRLADDFLLVDRDGAVKTKADLLKEIEPIPPAIALDLAVVDPAVRDLGDAAVLTFITRETEGIHGQALRVDYSNMMVFSRRAGQWRLVAWQYVEIPVDGDPVAIDAGALDRLTGEYEAAPGVTYRVTRKGDRLYGQREGREESELVPEGDTVFYVPGSEFRKIFLKDEKGAITGLLDRRKGTDLRWRKVR